MRSDYDVCIGLEIHAVLKTQTKLFCGCKNEFGDAPNSNVCPVCFGLPGALPVVNQQAVRLAIRAGLALGSTISKTVSFDRKHYFYPDLAKAYQISQNEHPICIGGGILLDNGKFVRINHIHLEEDAGKLVHDDATDQTFVDYNRGGVPLIEHVTEVDMCSAEEAVEFLTKLRKILTFAEVSDCKMEEGGMRCDVNVSVKKKGDLRLGVKVEMKNLNSFRSVGHAIDFEVARQIAEIESGGVILQETRKWDDIQNKSFSMRTKEENKDYRFMPEPDIPAVKIDDADIENERKYTNLTPEQKFLRYTESFGLPKSDAEILVSEKYISDYFDECIRLFNVPKTVANWIMTDLLKLLKEENFSTLSEIISPRHLCEIIKLVEEKKMSRMVAKNLMQKVIQTKDEPMKIVEEEHLLESVSELEIGKLVDELLREKPELREEYKVSPDKITNFVIGQVMHQTQGKADTEIVREYAIRKLK